MKLTNTQVSQSKANPNKDTKLSDGAGLYLHIKKAGGKYWRMSYRFHAKQKTLAIGVYPAVSLKQARDARTKAKEQLAQGIDPSQKKQADKLQVRIEAANTFETVGKLWHEKKSHEWSVTHAKDVIDSLERDVYPYIGHVSITEINTPMLNKVLDRVQQRGSLETAKRLRQRCSGIFTYGISSGICENDPAAFLRDVLKKPQKQHLPALAANEVPAYLDALELCEMSVQTRLAIKLMMLTFVRNSELREACWEEFDLEKGLWVIPAERMKKKNQGEHVVPLVPQALEALRQLQVLNGHREFLFPMQKDPRRPMSDGAIAAVIKRIGYRGRMTVHGYRSIASSVLNESGLFNPDAIERQLHHKEANAVRAAYNRAEYLAERTEMMQWWANWVDNCRSSNVVFPKFGEG